MNKLIALVFIYIITAGALHATHDRAFDLSYDHIPGTNSYVFYASRYVEVLPQQYAVGQHHFNLEKAGTTDTVGIYVKSIHSVRQYCNPNMAAGALILYSSDTIDLGPIPQSGYTFYFNTCCRAYGINTITNSVSQGWHLAIEMYPDPGQTYASSSPRFVNPALEIFVGNPNVTFNQPATDPDGDSIYIDLVPLINNGNTPMTYNAGYSPTQPFGPNTNTTINIVTGTITATNVPQGLFALNIEVRSYKNGVLTCKMHRDVTTVSLANAVPTPQLTLSNMMSSGGAFTSVNGMYQVVLAPGDSLSLTATAVSGPTDSISMFGLSRLFPVGYGTFGNCLNDCAQFQPNPTFDSLGTVSGIFRFNATNAHLNNGAKATHEVWFNGAAKDSCKPIGSANVLLQILVDPNYGIGLEEITQENFLVFPNPAHDYLEISGAAARNFVLYSATGEEIHSGKIASDNAQIEVAHLPRGLYLLRINNQMHKLILQ